jgi:hypothetical protein
MAAAPRRGMRVIVLGIVSLAAGVSCRSTPRESVKRAPPPVGQEIEATGRVASAELPPEAASATITSAELPSEAAAPPSSPYYSIVGAPNLADNLGIGDAGAPVAPLSPPPPPAGALPYTEVEAPRLGGDRDAAARTPSAADSVPWSGRR